MSTSVYTINKGINKPFEFKGIKAQYISYMAIGLVALLIFFSIIYIIGLPIYICLGVTIAGGYLLLNWVMRYSHKYGQYGLLKEGGYRMVPHSIHCPGRYVFTQLITQTLPS